MKKIIALLLAVMMIVGLFAGCGKKAETITLKVWAPQEDQGDDEVRSCSPRVQDHLGTGCLRRRQR